MPSLPHVFFWFGVTAAVLSAQQGVTGIVLDFQHNPIDYALVQSGKTDLRVLSDENGFFLFPSGIPIGDSLTVSRVGFKPTTIAVNQSRIMNVRLEQDVIPLHPIEVEGSYLYGNADWKKSHTSQTDRMTRNSALQSVPGSLLKTYGGRAGITLLGIDGGNPEHTKIVLDGIDLTSPQNGQTDLSEIPNIFYQQVFMSNNPGIEFGSGALDGVLHLRPWLNHSGLTLNRGSFGKESEAVSYAVSVGKTNFNFVGGRSREKGDFSYTSGDSSTVRKNNEFDQLFGGLQARYFHRQNTVLSGSLFLIDSERGAAGPISYPSADAYRTNELILAKAKILHLFSSGNFGLHISQRYNDEHYFSGSDSSHHQASSDKLSIDWKKKWSGNLATISSLIVRQESIIKSTSLGAHDRNHLEASVTVHVSLSSFFEMRSGIRLDKSTSQYTTYQLQGELRLPFQGRLTAGAGTGYQLPTFNDLYWPDEGYAAGNATLIPEESSNQFTVIQLGLANDGSIKLDWRSRESKNLIVWAAGSDFVWRPENLDKSNRENLTLSFDSGDWVPGISVSGNMSRIKTKNHVTGESLGYVPEQTGLLKIRFSFGILDLDFQSYYTGKRTYSGYDENYNTVQKSLDPFIDTTLGIHISVPKFTHFGVHIVFENLLDQNTSFFPDYPEPGRCLTAGVSANL